MLVLNDQLFCAACDRRGMLVVVNGVLSVEELPVVNVQDEAEYARDSVQMLRGARECSAR